MGCQIQDTREETSQKKPCVSGEFCDDWQNMKKERYEVVGAKEYREQRGSEGLEEIKEGLDSTQWEKQQKDSLSAGEGSNFREAG